MSAHTPRISIVITSFNHRAFLVDAIESVLAQTLMPHEIIVADDASTDGSQDTIRAYERRFPGLIRGVFRATNGGIPRNRNDGLRAVTGDYVGILDGDDWFLPHKLEVQVAALRAAGDATLVYGNFRVVDAARRPLRLKWSAPQPSGRVFPDIAAGKMGLLRTLIVDYRAVRDVGLMDERFVRYDGLWLTIQLAARCTVAYVDDVLVDKRDHSTSDSKSIRADERRRELASIHRHLLPMLPMHAPRDEAHVRSAWRRLLGASVDELAQA